MKKFKYTLSFSKLEKDRVYDSLWSFVLCTFKLVGFHVRSLYIFVWIFLSLGLAGCDNSSPYREFADAQDRCIFRVPMPEKNEDYELKFNYIQALLMQKTFDGQAYNQKYIPEDEKKSKYVEFDMQKSCQDIVEMIIDQL